MDGHIRDQLLYKLSEVRSNLFKWNKTALPESGYIFMNGVAEYSELLPIGIRAVKMSTLKKAFGFHKTKLAKLSAKLEKTGYIVKICDDFDRRSKYIALTAKGQQALDTEGKNIYLFADSIISRLGDNETRHLIHLIDELSEVLSVTQRPKAKINQK